MKRTLRFAGGLLAISMLLTPQAQAYLTVNAGDANVAATASFASNVHAASFDRASGNYFFGQTNANNAYNICYANYRTANQTPTLQGLATAPLLNNAIDNLRAVTSANPLVPTILVSSQAAAGGVLYALNTQNTTLASQQLYDANGGASGYVEAVAGGYNDTTSTGLFFGAVDNGSEVFGSSGSGIAAGIIGVAANGAVSLSLYDPVAGTQSDTASSVEADFLAVPAGNAPVAVHPNDNAAFVYGTTNAVVPGAATGAGGTGEGPTRQADAWYDPIIGQNSDGTGAAGRLYVGTSILTHKPTGGNNYMVAYGVGTFVVKNDANTLTVTPTKLQPAGLFNTNETPDTYMIAVATDHTSTGTQALEITHVRTMHTSTGLVYLITSGGASYGSHTSSAGKNNVIIADNNVWAIPLTNDSGSATADGLPADPSIFVDGQFTTLPTGFGTFTNDMITSASPAALVGGFYIANDQVVSLSVPCGAAESTVTGDTTTPFVDSYISDMYVDNDAVYVATSGPVGSNVGQATDAEQGLWRSQAVFNALGQIDHWTDWQKVIPNDMGDVSSAQGADGSVDFGAVDGYTGHVWAINNASSRAVVTQWANPASQTETGLAAAVNAALGNLCYSVLDLNNSTTNWGSETTLRATLFGGNGKVSFAWTGDAVAVDGVGTTTDVNVTDADSATNYTDAANLFTTTLPEGAGAVIALGFSGWTPNTAGNGGDNSAYATPGFFLAGCAGTATTAPAVYAYVLDTTQDDPAGFDVTALTALSDLDTDNAGWVQLESVTGLATRIQALGGNLHILGRSYANGDAIFTASKADTLSALDTFVVVAQAGTTPLLSTANQILDFVISVSAQGSAFAPTRGNEQLLALTTDGIYTTSCDIGMNAASTSLNQNAAGWVQVAGVEDGTPFSDLLAQPDYNRYPQMFHAAVFAANANIPYAHRTVYNRNIWQQFARASFDATTGSYVRGSLSQALIYGDAPSLTASYDVAQQFNQTTAPTIYSNFPVNARLLYDDGSRRFFIQANPANASLYQVLVLPYNAYNYNITANGKSTMQDNLVAQATGFFWMSPIGGLGRLTMSTTNGLISLQ